MTISVIVSDNNCECPRNQILSRIPDFLCFISACVPGSQSVVGASACLIVTSGKYLCICTFLEEKKLPFIIIILILYSMAKSRNIRFKLESNSDENIIYNEVRWWKLKLQILNIQNLRLRPPGLRTK